MKTPPSPYPRSGQAMIEFVVAILMVVIITAGILHFTELAGRRGELQAEIRGEAGRQAISGRVTLGQRPTYILDWQEGPDELRHTADDEMRRGSAAGTLQSTILAASVRNQSDWQELNQAHNTSLRDLYQSSLPLGNLGFIHAQRQDTLPLSPAMRNWLLGRDTITVGAELWFPHLELEEFNE